MSSPKVSIVMAAYNGAAYLDESVKSILNQTFVDFEFIIIDDCSSDGTASILDSYAALDRRVVVLKNSHNLGLAASLNRGIEAATGEFIARMDDDDVALPERLQEQVNHMEAHPDTALLSTAVQHIDSDGNYLEVYCPPTDAIALRWHLVYQSPIRHPTVLWRSKEVGDVVTSYNPKNKYAEDYEFFCAIARELKIESLAQPLLKMRRRPGSVTHSKGREQDHCSAQITYHQLDHYLPDRLTQEQKVNLRILLRRYYFFQKNDFLRFSSTTLAETFSHYLDLLDGFYNIHKSEIASDINAQKYLQDEAENTAFKVLIHCLRKGWINTAIRLFFEYTGRYPNRLFYIPKRLSKHVLSARARPTVPLETIGSRKAV